LPSRRPLAACLLALCCASAPGALRSAFAADVAPQDAAATSLAYRVVVEAPRAVKDAVEASLDLIRWQGYEDMTEDLLDRLIVEAIAQAKEAAAAVGHFSAHVDIAVERPDAQAKSPLTLRVAIDAGPATRIASVQIGVTGAAEDDPAGRAAIAKARREWLLPAGDVFRQAAWTAAKARAVATIAASPYASARIDASEARVDPAAERADLEITIASGPPFRFGALEIEGLQRYDRSLVENFSTIAAGERYDEGRLDQFIRRLNTSGYFASVQAALDRDPAHADAASVRINVIEAPPRRFEAGIAFTTDTRFRGNFRYSDVNVDKRGLQLALEARADAKIQRFDVRATRPPNASGWIDSYRASSERTDISNLLTHTYAVGVTRADLEERNRTAYSVTFYEDDQRPANEARIRSRALYTAIERTWRNVDDLLAPSSGYMIDVELGGAPPGLATRGLARGIVKSAAWIPLGRDNTVTLRAEAGLVAASAREGVPSVLLFRTGGDTSVRGYAFESLGVKNGDAIVGGRYYALASAEAIHYFTPDWGAAVFVDAGNANDDLSSFRPALGYGAGARIRTPIGPLRIDVAYGQDTHDVRLHLSVGLTF
jgi:translocation and assembly module TamA